MCLEYQAASEIYCAAEPWLSAALWLSCVASTLEREKKWFLMFPAAAGAGGAAAVIQWEALLHGRTAALDLAKL